MARHWLSVAFVLLMAFCVRSYATETENVGTRVLPTPGKVTVDGKLDDWDLSGGTLACGDAEGQRDAYSVWVHLMYDAENLYVLARWKDPAPLNHWGSSKGDYGFAGDCLQFRTVTDYGIAEKERFCHCTCWRDRDRIDIMDLCYGRNFNEGSLRDAQTAGGKQEFQLDADGKGYVQQISIPWKLLTKDGRAPKAGDTMVLTLEPNFTVGKSGRLTIKDIFRPGMGLDKVFTFMTSGCWGVATLEAKGKVRPQPVRLADAREFAVSMQGGVPVVDWTGLIKQRQLNGFKPLPLKVPDDGYVSLIIRNADGVIVRQLLGCDFFTKGEHELKWDGLTTPGYKRSGQPVPPGNYTWNAIFHKGIGLRLRGFACNGGSTPWDNGPGTNWGGDHGVPVTCAADSEKVYIGWSGAEAGKAMVAVDLEGVVKWNQSRSAMSGCTQIAVDGNTVYGLNGPHALFRVDANSSVFTFWAGRESTDLAVNSIWGDPAGKPGSAAGMDAKNGKLYLTFTSSSQMAVVDGANGKLIKAITLEKPGLLRAASDTLVYVVSDGKAVLAVNPASGEVKPVVGGLQNATGVAVDADGNIYVGTGEPDCQVKVFAADGKPVRQIAVKGGRPLLGPWNRNGLRSIAGMVVDSRGRLWVTEADECPKRVSVWDTKSGAFVREFFGPTHYGASGGAINPVDPNIMAGEGCEWRLDPNTGLAACIGVFQHAISGFARYCQAGGRLFIVSAGARTTIYERLGDGKYLLRGAIFSDEKKTSFWADENGDEKESPDEMQTIDARLQFGSGWGGSTPLSLYINRDLTVTAGTLVKVGSFTKCGAPKYDVAGARKLPVAGMGTPDNSRILDFMNAYGTVEDTIHCHDIATGKLLWTYPSHFTGVHGSHLACPPEPGMIRGGFGIVGNAKFPAPLGSIWVINGNCGEWYVLTEDGFYLTRLFQGDGMKWSWPDKAAPGAIMDNCPPGLGGEDFGGSAQQANARPGEAAGKLYVQAGKTGLWNLEVVGLDSVKAIKGGTLAVGEKDITTAQGFRERYLQEIAGKAAATLKKQTPAFTGDLDNDFKGAQVLSYKKQDAAAVRSAAAWDDKFLYLGWDVKDNTPWVNGAGEPAALYVGGDTVDFQLGTDPKANNDRQEAVLGDLRLSIGNFQGKPAAVLYRKISDAKKPKTFSSGVVKEYTMDFVDVLADAKVEVKARQGQGYTVEAAIPLAALGLKPAAGLTLRGDFGVTHGDPGGTRTRLRTYWSNQHTGIVDDAVFELMLEPKNWGELNFKE